jgi:UDP-3-O-[3-hydroxymyristoyl] glucosamine N-acyltransferase
LPFTLCEIAVRLGADLRGEDATVDGVAPLDTAGPRQLSLCSDIRQADALISTRAAGVLLARRASDLIERSPCSLLLVDDVRAGLAQALQMFHPHQPPTAGVSVTASVHASARIDPSACIESQAAVGEGARVGPRSRVAAGAILGIRVSLGADCLIA